MHVRFELKLRTFFLFLVLVSHFSSLSKEEERERFCSVNCPGGCSPWMTCNIISSLRFNWLITLLVFWCRIFHKKIAQKPGTSLSLSLILTFTQLNAHKKWLVFMECIKLIQIHQTSNFFSTLAPLFTIFQIKMGKRRIGITVPLKRYCFHIEMLLLTSFNSNEARQKGVKIIPKLNCWYRFAGCWEWVCW